MDVVKDDMQRVGMTEDVRDRMRLISRLPQIVGQRTCGTKRQKSTITLLNSIELYNLYDDSKTENDRDRSRADRNRIQRYANDVEEPEYDVVDNQEEVLSVRILPARPINDDQEYADRDLPRSSSAHNLSSLAPGNSNILPRCPPRETSFTTAPVINRDLKPGRQKMKTGINSHIWAYTVYILYTRKQVHTLPVKSLHTPSHLMQRAKETKHIKQLNKQRRHQFRPPWTKRVPSKRHHHEWPQTKEDFDQHDFVPMEKPQQTCEEDWYIGTCSQADAEHALHLDGAFLVRDCSTNSNFEPLVLVVYHEKKVYNVKIRFVESTKKYALGTGYRSNDMFDSVADIIKFHSIFPITLVSGRTAMGNKNPDNCVLTFPITKGDVERLLQ
ncbi:leukocyte elastase inhibitor [Sarotherodon galilaeus]